MDAGSRARGTIFLTGFPATSHLYESRKQSISGHVHTPLAQLAPFTFPRKAGSQGCLQGWQQTPKAADSCTLTPFVFLRALGLVRLLPCGCTWLRCPQALHCFAALQLCSPEPWPLAFASQALQNSGFSPCSCAVPASQCKQKRPVRWDFPKY